jgi:hypothetical protein
VSQQQFKSQIPFVKSQIQTFKSLKKVQAINQALKTDS